MLDYEQAQLDRFREQHGEVILSLVKKVRAKEKCQASIPLRDIDPLLNKGLGDWLLSAVPNDTESKVVHKCVGNLITSVVNSVLKEERATGKILDDNGIIKRVWEKSSSVGRGMHTARFHAEQNTPHNSCRMH